MRSVFLLLALLLLTVRPALAQEQEQGLLQRIEAARPDSKKVFDLRQSMFSGRQLSDSGKSGTTKDFQFDQKVRTKEFGTRNFRGAKSSWMGDVKFTSKAAPTKGKYEIPNVNKRTGDKRAPVKEAREANQTMATRGLHDGKRPFLGPESEKVRRKVDPKTLANWRGAGQAVGSTGQTIEVYDELKELSIDDIRELLNKNK